MPCKHTPDPIQSAPVAQYIAMLLQPVHHEPIFGLSQQQMSSRVAQRETEECSQQGVPACNETGYTPAAEANWSGVSAQLSCPLRTAAPSTLAPASRRS